MQFTPNRVPNPDAPIDQRFGENAALLEERLNQTNWKVLARYYAYGFGTLLISLFLLIVTIRLALGIF